MIVILYKKIYYNTNNVAICLCVFMKRSQVELPRNDDLVSV
jgi:hypothetical protein